MLAIIVRSYCANQSKIAHQLYFLSCGINNLFVTFATVKELSLCCSGSVYVSLTQSLQLFCHPKYSSLYEAIMIFMVGSGQSE